MNRNSLTTAVIAGIAGVAGLTSQVGAVNLNPDGLGQVLLYPYYTVNGGQQTLLSVVNTTNVGKAVKVRFLEGYNSREVLDFNLFLSPFDVWTATVFALNDVGAGTAGAGITTTDKSCTFGTFATPNSNLASGTYQAFKSDAYTGAYTDTGPTSITRTQEGHFEMITMADIIDGSDLDGDITHAQPAGVPPACNSAEGDFVTSAGGAVPGQTEAPTSGIFGAAAVVNVGNGTYYAYNADALDGFTSVNLASDAGSLLPSLSSVNDSTGTTATSYVFDDGALVTSSWPVTGTPGTFKSQIDAVSSVFMAANIYNEYESSAGTSGTDWVVTFPTKRFYVDPVYTGNVSTAFKPFEEVFGLGDSGDGLSCVVIGISIFNREEGTITPEGCGFSPCTGQPPSSICYETNVITFNANSGTTSVLDSTLNRNILPNGTAGWANLSLVDSAGVHQLRPANNLNLFSGLPITGFSAVRFTNGSVTYNGASVLSNYSGVFRHRISRDCTNGAGACS